MLHVPDWAHQYATKYWDRLVATIKKVLKRHGKRAYYSPEGEKLSHTNMKYLIAQELAKEFDVSKNFGAAILKHGHDHEIQRGKTWE